MAMSATPVCDGDVTKSQANGRNMAAVTTQTRRLCFMEGTHLVVAVPGSLTRSTRADIASDQSLSYSRRNTRTIPLGALMSRTLLVALALTMTLALFGCESGEDSTASATPDPQDVAASVDVSSSADVSASSPAASDALEPTPSVDAGAGMADTTMTPEPEPEPEPVDDWVYPAGPYGKDKFDIIEDMSFFDPWENRWVHLHEYHNDPSKKMLVLIAGAGWCGACRLEAEDLVEYYDEYEKDGLGLLYTLYEDNAGKELFIPGEPAVADMAFMNDWKNTHGVDYPLVADVGFTLEEYFTDSSTPLTMVIRTEDMLIKYVDQGYSSTFLDYQILMNLYN
jgi:thiol-disulfide isomerase/thioredoxin